jgi:N-acyl-D-aspartate/D-glutamate deacylase
VVEADGLVVTPGWVYRHTFVAGVETYRAGEWTGATPGRLLRAAT